MAEAKTEIIPYFSYPGLKVFKTSINLPILLKTHREKCLDAVRDVICDYYIVTTKQFHSIHRDTPIPLCKQLFCYICKKKLFPSVSSTALGKYIREANNVRGKYDHTTVLHGIKLIEDFLNNGEVEHETYDELMYKITLKLNDVWQSYQSAGNCKVARILLVK